MNYAEAYNRAHDKTLCSRINGMRAASRCLLVLVKVAVYIRYIYIYIRIASLYSN